MSTNKSTAVEFAVQPEHKNELTGSHAAGLLARKPYIGLILFIFGSLVFAGMAFNLTANGPLLVWDQDLAKTLPYMALNGPAFLQPLMYAGFLIGDQLIAVFSIFLGLLFIIKRLWKELTMMAIGLVGASSFFLLITHHFARPRPPTQIWVVLNIPGFPSGHANSTVVFYGLMAYLLVPKMRSVLSKVAVIAAALIIIFFVGFSRVFTAGHYLTDVIAGYALGLAWSSAIFTIIEIVFQKIRSRNVKKE